MQMNVIRAASQREVMADLCSCKELLEGKNPQDDDREDYDNPECDLL